MAKYPKIQIFQRYVVIFRVGAKMDLIAVAFFMGRNPEITEIIHSLTVMGENLVILVF